MVCVCVFFDCWHCDLGVGMVIFGLGWVYGIRDLSLALSFKLHGSDRRKGDAVKWDKNVCN